MANQNFTYLRASVIDGYWHVWDQNGDEKNYYAEGKAGIDRLIRKYGSEGEEFFDLYFKMFEGGNVRITNDVYGNDFPPEPNSISQSTTQEFTLTAPQNEQAVIKFAQMMEEAYLSEKRPDEFTQKKTFSPSTVGYGSGNCPRYWFIAFTGAEFENNTDAMGIANMANGTYMHERIQKIMGKTPVFKSHETEITHDDPPIRGFADTFIEWNGKEVIAEIKSAKDEVFAIRQAEMKPLPYHLVQLLTYMKIRGDEQGFFYYENKNDQSFLIIPVNMNERNTELIDYVFDWERKVYAAYQAGTLPERTFTKSTSACKYCPVKNVCWKDMKNEIGEVFIPALEIPK